MKTEVETIGITVGVDGDMYYISFHIHNGEITLDQTCEGLPLKYLTKAITRLEALLAYSSELDSANDDQDSPS